MKHVKNIILVIAFFAIFSLLMTENVSNKEEIHAEEISEEVVSQSVEITYADICDGLDSLNETYGLPTIEVIDMFLPLIESIPDSTTLREISNKIVILGNSFENYGLDVYANSDAFKERVQLYAQLMNVCGLSWTDSDTEEIIKYENGKWSFAFSTILAPTEIAGWISPNDTISTKGLVSKYTINYEIENYTGPSIDPIVVETDEVDSRSVFAMELKPVPYILSPEQLPLPGEFKKIFDGWYLNSDYSGEKLLDGDEILGDVTLHARMQEKQKELFEGVNYRNSTFRKYWNAVISFDDYTNLGESNFSFYISFYDNDPLNVYVGYVCGEEALCFDEAITIHGVDIDSMTYPKTTDLEFRKFYGQQIFDLRVVKMDNKIYIDSKYPFYIFLIYMNLDFSDTIIYYDENVEFDVRGKNVTLEFGDEYLIDYSLEYETNGGNEIEGMTSTTHLPEVLPIPTKEGYKFLGWYYDVEFTGTAVPGARLNGDTTLYAKWQELYNIQLYLNEGFLSPGTPETYSNVEYFPDISTPMKEGYTFLGWYLDENCTISSNYQIDDLLTEDLNLYAKWERKQVTIIFETNGGSDIDMLLVPSPYVVANLPIPTKEGYIFKGWYTDENCNIPVSEGVHIESDTTFYANWEEKIYLEIVYMENIYKFSKNDVINMNEFPSLDLDFEYWICDSAAQLISFSEVKDLILMQDISVKVYVKRIYVVNLFHVDSSYPEGFSFVESVNDKKVLELDNLKNIFSSPIEKDLIYFYREKEMINFISLEEVKAKLLDGLDVNIYFKFGNFGTVTYIFNSKAMYIGKLNDEILPVKFNTEFHYKPTEFYLDALLSNKINSMQELRDFYISNLMQDVNVYCVANPVPYYNSDIITIYKNSNCVITSNFIKAELFKYFKDPENSLFTLNIKQDDYTGYGDKPGKYKIILVAKNSYQSEFEIEIFVEVVENLGVNLMIGDRFYITTATKITKEGFLDVLKSQGKIPTENLNTNFSGDDYFATPTTSGNYEMSLNYNSNSGIEDTYNYTIVVLNEPVYDVVEKDISPQWWEYLISILLISLFIFVIVKILKSNKKKKSFSKKGW